MRSLTAFLPATPAFILRHRRLLAVVCIALLCETAVHIYSSQPANPPVRLDAPFYAGCQDTSKFEAAPRENATILMLARNQDVDGAVSSIKSLEEKFNSWAKYPITFLNDEAWGQEFKDAVTAVASGGVEFGVIGEEMWGFPDWVDEEAALLSMAAQGQAGILHANKTNYHHMCRFNSGMFYDHSLLQKYKWYWRVEPDVRFTCRITYDPFVAMAQNGKKYGYVMALWEIPETAPSLFRAISSFKSAHSLPSTPLWHSLLTPSYLPWPLRPLLLGPSWTPWSPHHNAAGDSWNLCHFWSNFEIASLDWYRTPLYRSLFAHLDSLGGFYFERWGDAPVHSLAAALLLESGEVHHFSDFGYVHFPYQYCAFGEPLGDSPGGEDGGKVPDLSKEPQEGLRQLGCECVCDDTLVPRPVCLNKIKQTVL